MPDYIIVGAPPVPTDGYFVGIQDGLEIHFDQRFTYESLIYKGTGNADYSLWINKTGTSVIKKLWIYNRSNSIDFTDLILTFDGDDSEFDVKFASDVSGSPGTFGSSKTIWPEASGSVEPHSYIPFWIKMENASGADAVRKVHDPFIQLSANRDGEDDYFYRAFLVLARTLRFETVLFSLYSNVEGASVSLDYAGYIESMQLSNEDDVWYDATEIMNKKNGVFSFPSSKPFLGMALEIADGAINRYQLKPYFAYRT